MPTELAFDDADLNAFVDGRIDPSRGTALAESLASDPEALARLDAWRRQNDTLRTMFSAVLFEPVPVRLLPVAVAPRDGAGTRARDGNDHGQRPAGVVATLCVGAALIGFALGALASLETGDFGLAPAPLRAPDSPLTAVRETPDLASRAAEAHRTFAALSGPVDLAAAEEPKLARWIGHHLGAGVHLPDLARQGWSFTGARLVPGRHGPAAFLTYGNGADRIGLTVSHEADAGDGLLVTADDDGSHLDVATWNEGAFGYALSSDRGRDRLGRTLAPLRDSLKAQARTGIDAAPVP